MAQVDFAGGEIRLDSGRTKNREARVFPMTDDLRALLERRSAQHQELKRAGHIVPFVFVRMIAEGRGGALRPHRVVSLTKRGRQRVVPQAVQVGFHTTSVARPSAR